MKERWFNYRPICLVCAFLMLGSIFAFYFTVNMPLLIIIASLVLISLLVLAIYKKKLQYFGVPLTAFIIGVFAYNLAIISYSKTVEYKPNLIEARIAAIGNKYDNYIKVQADSCTFDGEEVDDNIYIIIYDYSNNFEHLEIGRKVSFETNTFNKNDLFYYETPNSKLYFNDIKYTAIVKTENINYGEIDKTFAEEARGRVKDGLSLSLTKSNVELAYSALFGDKTTLDDERYAAFKLSGVAHLLAVSGLHVGIIVMVLNYLLRPLKYKKWTRFSIIAIFLSYYIYLCDFSMSVIRASIMAVILLISKILNEEYDVYNSIAIAGIVIFLINPLCIFDVSFLMSFACVLGIAMLYKPIYLALTKLKISRKVLSALAMSLSTTISLIMIMAFYFNNFNVISIFANVILIPLFTIAFIPTFIISMVAGIIPYVAYLLFPLNYLFDFIAFLAKCFGDIAIANFNTISINFIAILVYFVLIVLIGKLCSAKSEYKFAISLPILALLFYCML